jgi:hypothetical protein
MKTDETVLVTRAKIDWYSSLERKGSRFMGNQSFKKKAACLSERSNQKATTDNELRGEKPTTVLHPEESTRIGNPRYFSCSIRPRDPRKKSEITLYACRRS